MTIRQYFKYLGLFVIGIILMISFIKFSICFKEMEHVKEDFTYIYRTPFPVTELREKCKTGLSCDRNVKYSLYVQVFKHLVSG